MTSPQTPEVARSRRSAATASSAKSRASSVLPTDRGPTGPVPVENQPGHHPEADQDKPVGQPPTPPLRRRFSFRWDRAFTVASAPFGVTPDNAYVDVDVDGDKLEIGFGRWRVSTSVSNVDHVERTGPYRWWKVAGPPHLSAADRGLTFGTNATAGVCITFRTPVPGLLPIGALRHPAVTVTVDDPDVLVRLLDR